MDSIYLDHNATTPIRPEVIEAMAQCCAAGHANPASQHQPGQHARKVLEDTRERIAEILGADLGSLQPDRLVFTASATEANNLAVLGIARGGTASGEAVAHLIISAVEHQSVIEPALHLYEGGWRLDTLGVTSDGVVRTELLPGLLRTGKDTTVAVPKGTVPFSSNENWDSPPLVPSSVLSGTTRVVSVLLGNHDTGVLQPVAELAAVCNAAGVPLHTDAVQVVGKLPVDFRKLGVAAMSIGAHKFRGPLGIGALILRHDVPIRPIFFGGNQQSGLRPGTEAIPLAVGMATALELWQKEQQAHARHLTTLRERFEQALKAGIPGLIVHGESVPRLPNTSSIAFPGVDGEVLRIALSMAGVACSVGSACSSGSTELSPTLRAMGLPTEVVGRSLRFSLGAANGEAEVDEAVRRIVRVCDELRG